VNLLELCGSVMAIAFVSAFLPAVPIEPYLVAGSVLTDRSGAVLLGVAAGVGQLLGKLILFLGARGTLRSPWLRRWIQRKADRLRQRSADADAEDGSEAGSEAGSGGRSEGGADAAVPRRRWGWRPFAAALRRWSAAANRALQRPYLSVPILLLSAVVGVPPLLLVTFYVAYAGMPVWVFTSTCLVGRVARFVAIASAPHLFGVG
jgi:membrane protein YqaA with SNARE-associated domain